MPSVSSVGKNRLEVTAKHLASFRWFSTILVQLTRKSPFLVNLSCESGITIFLCSD
jgi:hypothetical protein